MRGFLWGVAFVVVFAVVTEAAFAQEEAFTNEDLVNTGLFGVGAILMVLGYISGKQR